MRAIARRNLYTLFCNCKLNRSIPFLYYSDDSLSIFRKERFCFQPLPHCSRMRIINSIADFPLTRDGNFHGATDVPVCPGCGVHMQDKDPKKPGFFSRPSEKWLSIHSKDYLVPISLDSHISNSMKADFLQPDESPPSKMPAEQNERPVVCARCHSLRHYGKVKDLLAEKLLPEFDFFHTVGTRLTSAAGSRTVVLIVVDVSDFDGTFPSKVANLISDAIKQNATNWKEGKPGNVARLLVVATKIDLLPTEISPTQFEQWLRQRIRDGGANSMKRLHFVSAVRNWGIKDLVDDVIELVGPRGNVWAVGTQNAGKSTLINAMARCGDGKPSYLTEAPVPGTTLGIVRVEGVLPGNVKFFDTPGLLNSRQITSRLTMEEQKLVRMTKELKPRTYRIKKGHSIHIGGLMRLDTEQLSVDTIYVTVWVSPLVPLHMGKTENANTLMEEHFGRQLQPPIGATRVQELGKWVRHEIEVSCGSWDRSSVDIAGGGIGWFAVALKGEATLGVWTYEGVEVVVRNSLIPHRSKTFEVAGFTASKVVSRADQTSDKLRRREKAKKMVNEQLFASD